MEGTQKAVSVLTCSLLRSTEAAQSKIKKNLKRKTPTLLPSPEPEQAPGTALIELPDVEPPAACEQLTSAPGRPVVPGLVPQCVSAAMADGAPTPPLYTV